MRVRCLLFGAARQAAGTADVELELAEPATAEDVVAAAVERYPELGPIRAKLSVAVNRKVVEMGARVQAGDEVALLPPMGGGAPAVGFRVGPLDVNEVIGEVQRPEAGAVVAFVGTVRSSNQGKQVERLVYEAYEKMAAEKMYEVAERIEASFEGVRVAGLHRVGRLEVGEVSVVLAASAPHRAEAFEACRAFIEGLKEEVPVFKKEFFADGTEQWVGLGEEGQKSDE